MRHDSDIELQEGIVTTIDIGRIDHIGVRIADASRAEGFYGKLGFRVVTKSQIAPVVVLRNAQGVEIHLVVNADAALDGTNVLLDATPKRAGYTHIALGIASVDAAAITLRALGIAITEGPTKLGDGVSLFVRDPDSNVVELHEVTAAAAAP